MAGRRTASRGKPPELYPEWRDVVLAGRRLGWSTRRCAYRVGVSPETVEAWLAGDPAFAAEYRAAYNEAADLGPTALLDAVRSGDRWAIERLLAAMGHGWGEDEHHEVDAPAPDVGDGGVVVRYDYGAQPPGVPPVKPPEPPDDAE